MLGLPKLELDGDGDRHTVLKNGQYFTFTKQQNDQGKDIWVSKQLINSLEKTIQLKDKMDQAIVKNQEDNLKSLKSLQTTYNHTMRKCCTKTFAISPLYNSMAERNTRITVGVDKTKSCSFTPMQLREYMATWRLKENTLKSDEKETR